MNQHTKAVLQLLTVVAIAALISVLTKSTLNRVSPFTFTWLQVLIGGFVLFNYQWFRKQHRLSFDFSTKTWFYLIAIGLLNFVFARLFFMLSLQKLPVVTHAYLINLTGILTMILSGILLKEKPSKYQWLGALIAFLGLTVYFREIPVPEQLLGILYVSVVILSLALTNNFTRFLMMDKPKQVNAQSISLYAIIFGGIPLVLSGIYFDGLVLNIRSYDWLVVFLNGIFIIAIGLTVFNHVLGVLRSYEVSLMASGSVIFAALFAIPILNVTLAWHEIIGILIMMLGLGLVQVKRESNN